MRTKQVPYHRTSGLKWTPTSDLKHLAGKFIKFHLHAIIGATYVHVFR